MSEKYKKIPATYIKAILTTGTNIWGLIFNYDIGSIHVLKGNARMINRIIKILKPLQKVIINYAEELDWYLELE